MVYQTHIRWFCSWCQHIFLECEENVVKSTFCLTVFLVNLSMALQCKSIRKCGRTNITFKWFLARMHFRMVLQMSGLTERRSACFTFVRFLARMNASMVPQRCMSGKSFVAHLAHVRFLAAVRPFVIFQVGRLWKLHPASSTPVKWRNYIFY